MAYVTHLRCSRCGSEYRLEDGKVICDRDDLGRLDIYYDYEAISRTLTKEALEKRRGGVWRYFELLPVSRRSSIVSLGEGGTPMIRSERLSRHLGLKNLYLKDETRNPTASFKDRSMTVGVSKAVELGVKKTCTASSGNAAAALAAYSAKAGLECYAFVLEEASIGKISQLQLYGAKVFRVRRVEEGVDPTVQLLRLVVKNYGWYPCPSFGPFNPYQVEGPKTISYEIVEQLGWRIPDWILIPTGSSCLLAGIWKGLRDYYELGWIDHLPRLAAIQSTGNAPFVRAFKEGMDPMNIEPWRNPRTVASGLMDPYPWDGDAGLIALKETDGVAEAVPDDLILEAQKLLASMEGVFAEPSGAAGLAGAMKLLEDGVIDPSDEVVVLVTGSGLKDPDIVKSMFAEPPMIGPSLEEFRRMLNRLG